MAYEACISAIIKASDDKLTDDDLGAVLDEILRRKARRSKPGQSSADQVRKIAEEFGRDIEEAEAIVKRTAFENAAKRVARRGVQASAPSPELGLEANLVGVNAEFAGSRASVDAAQRAMDHDWMGGLDIDLRKSGLEKYANSGMDDDAVARELAELNRRDGTPGVTGNARAKTVAAIFWKYQRASMEAVNRAGGWIKPYDGYVARNIHDSDKIRGLKPHHLLTGRATFPAEGPAQARWAQFILDYADLDRTFGGRDQALKALPGEWKAFVAGEHIGDLNLEETPPFVGANMGKKTAASRVYHWKSPEGWAAYNREFGAGSTAAAIVMGLHSSARAAGLMQVMGTNPGRALESDILEWRKVLVNDKTKLDRLTKMEPTLRNQMMVLDGTINRPLDAVSAARLQAWMRVQRLAKLGSAPFAAISDLATKAAELRYQGVHFLDRYRTALTGYLPAMGPERKEAAEVLRAGIDSRINLLQSRFESETSRPGMGATVEHLFFKYTGLSAMTDNQRLDAQMIMSRNIGLQKGKGFDALSGNLTGLLSGFGFDAKTWDLLRTVDWKIGGEEYFTPQIVDAIDDNALKAYAGARRLGDVRADLKQKILSYIHDRGIYAVLEPTARTRATMTQGKQAGNFAGNAIRLVGQFKAFPVSMLQQTWGRELYGGQGRMGKLAGIAELMAASLVLGYVSMSLRDIASGRTPRDPTDPETIASAFMAGGGLSIYGDFLFGNFARYGASAGDMLAGPTFGQITAVMDLKSKWMSGQDGAAQAFKILKQNIPGQNIWMTRQILDFLVVYRIQEALNPGYLGRLERNLKKQNQQNWWLPPTSAKN